VNHPETLLSFDPATRHLSVGGGSRKDTRTAPVMAAVVELLEDAEPLSGRQIEEALTDAGHGRDEVRRAVKQLRKDGRVKVEDGPRRAKLHTLNPSVRGSARPVRGALVNECASAPIGRTLAHSPPESSSAREQKPAHSLEAEPAAAVLDLLPAAPAVPSLCGRCGEPLGTADLTAGTGVCGFCEEGLTHVG
jgi:biotin operon repressor